MTKYLVIELQTFPDGAMTSPAYAYDTQASAENKYHTILASAAVSKLPIHTALLINNRGYVMETKCYEHEEVAAQ